MSKVKTTKTTPRISVSGATKKYIAQMAKYGISESQFTDKVFGYFKKNFSAKKVQKLLNYGTKA